MSFDASKPANDEKIRNLGTVIRANWLAIQQADSTFQPWAVNFVDRSTIVGSNTPTAITDVGQVYARNDGSETELFWQDDQSNELQLTTQGEIGTAGASGTRYRFRDFTYDGTFRYSYDVLPTAWANIDSLGNINSQFNVASCVLSGTGNYTITFDTAMNDANYVALGTVVGNSGIAVISAQSTTQVVITTYTAGGSAQIRNFNLLVVGGR